MPPPATSIDPARLADALGTHIQVLREEQARTAEIDRRMQEAQRVLAECAREREESAKRQAVFSQTVAYYEELLRLSGGTSARTADEAGQAPAVEAQDVKPRLVARLGKQHYRMLHALRTRGALSPSGLAVASVVSLRRVKVQMAEDAERGVVSATADGYQLTAEGEDLLQRFEDFRRSAGQELPPLVVPQSEADRDEADPETQTDGGEA